MSAALANEPMAKLGCESVEEPDFDESLVAAFERVAVTFASRIALGSDVWEPTYRELFRIKNRDRTGRKSIDRNLARANGVSDLYVRHNRSPKGCDENPPTASESRCRSHRGHAVTAAAPA
jgi:hypothetical protein